MATERPSSFGAAVERASRRARRAPAGLSNPAARPLLSRWAAGILAAGAMLAAAWIIALVAAPDRLALALAPSAPCPTPAALAGVALPTVTQTATRTPASSPTPTWTAVPSATQTRTPMPSATPAPSVTPALSPARLVIPGIGVDTGVVPVGWHLVSRDGAWETEWEVPSEAAGWHNTSARPGQAGNTVLSGHHNIEGLVFRDLSTLKAGAEVTLYAGPLEFHYRVVETMIVQEKGVSAAQRQENTRWIGPFPDERLTLVTCWPADNNTHRVIVVAKPVYR